MIQILNLRWEEEELSEGRATIGLNFEAAGLNFEDEEEAGEGTSSKYKQELLVNISFID